MTVVIVFAFTTRVSGVYPHRAMHLVKRLEEHGTNVIKELCHNGGYTNWQTGELHIDNSVEGTAIAAVTFFGEIRVYYQTFQELYLKECCWNLIEWVPGEFIRLVYTRPYH
jgi:hypothetical protein